MPSALPLLRPLLSLLRTLQHIAITGTVVKHIQVAPGDKVTLDLSAGYYIVKVDRYSTRVAVK